MYVMHCVNKDIYIYRQTIGIIQRLNNNIQLLLIGAIVSEKFCFKKCVCL